MSIPKSTGFALIIGLIYGIWLVTEPAFASDISVPRATARTLSTTLKNELLAGFPRAVQRVYTSAGTNQFAFGLPEDFHMNAYAEKILLTGPKDSCFLTFRILNPITIDLTESSVSVYRKLALSQFPAATISNELTGRVTCHIGPSFDLQWQNASGGKQAARITYIPVTAGVLEISVVTTPDRFGNDQYYFNSLLAGLVTNEVGKLQSPTPPGDS